MIAHIKLDDRLSILREEDRFRRWDSLHDQRVCILCEREFNGRQVQIRRFANGRCGLRCPTEGCNSEPYYWVYPGALLISGVTEPSWWRAAAKQPTRRTAEITPQARGHRV